MTPERHWVYVRPANIYSGAPPWIVEKESGEQVMARHVLIQPACNSAYIERGNRKHVALTVIAALKMVEDTAILFDPEVPDTWDAEKALRQHHDVIGAAGPLECDLCRWVFGGREE